jgi:hypothetical protein
MKTMGPKLIKIKTKEELFDSGYYWDKTENIITNGAMYFYPEMFNLIGKIIKVYPTDDTFQDDVYTVYINNKPVNFYFSESCYHELSEDDYPEYFI